MPTTACHAVLAPKTIYAGQFLPTEAGQSSDFRTTIANAAVSIDLFAQRASTMEGGSSTPNMLAPPAVASLRAGLMERSLSEDIRDQREELREAAEQTLNVIMDLNLDGTIRWVSPSWTDVIGTQPESVTGTAIADLMVSEDKSVFTTIVESMKKDDSRSQFLRFAVRLGPLSRLFPLENVKEDGEPPDNAAIDLEAQGIMVYDGASGGESHVSLNDCPRSCAFLRCGSFTDAV